MTDALYTARAHAVGGRQGAAKTDDGKIDVVLGYPKELCGDGKGTNPEELIGAAHAGCFTMQLSALLGNAGFTADRLRTTAKVHLEKQGAGFAIPRIELELEGTVPGLDAAAFQKHAEAAKVSCPVSKALAGTEITLTTRLK